MPIAISTTVPQGFVLSSPMAIAIKSPTIGSHVSSAAHTPYLPTLSCTAINFSRFTLKYRSIHSHLHNHPSKKLIIPPAVLPAVATAATTHLS